MGKVTVYRFRLWDNHKGDFEEASTRMGTREAIARVRGTAIEDTGIEIDETLLGREEPGLTDKNFQP